MAQTPCLAWHRIPTKAVVLATRDAESVKAIAENNKLKFELASKESKAEKLISDYKDLKNEVDAIKQSFSNRKKEMKKMQMVLSERTK